MEGRRKTCSDASCSSAALLPIVAKRTFAKPAVCSRRLLSPSHRTASLRKWGCGKRRIVISGHCGGLQRTSAEKGAE